MAGRVSVHTGLLEMSLLSFPLKFVTLSVFAIALSFFFSWLGIRALPIGSILFWMSVIFLVFNHIQSLKSHQKFSPKLLLGWGFFLLGLGIAANWMGGLWVAPSNDDTLNHLAFLDAILKSQYSLLGKINRPGSNWFGLSPYHFYPSGAHALMALFLWPFFQMKVSVATLYRTFLILTMALWPAFLWWSSCKLFPEIKNKVRVFLLISVFTLPLFPIFALGEGGMSRIMGMVLIVPIWFELLKSRERFWIGFLWSAIFFPVLLMIHPSLIILFLVGLIFSSRRMLAGTGIGLILGGLLFFGLLHTAPQDVFDPELLRKMTADLPSGLEGWFQRLKGPFHYFFADSMGLGKFFSPKNYFIYVALFLAFFGKLPRRILFFFFIPFGIAALALIPSPVAQLAGIPFYHSVKRIAEWIPILSFTLACFAAQRLEVEYFFWKKHARAIGVFCVVTSVLFLFVFLPKSKEMVVDFNRIFKSPLSAEVDRVKEITLQLSPEADVLIDDHEFDFLRFELPQKVYTLRPECQETGNISDYCVKRTNFAMETVLHPKSYALTKEFWWLPSKLERADANGLITKFSLKTIEISKEVRLVRIHEAQAH